jgi:hypothetical protein
MSCVDEKTNAKYCGSCLPCPTTLHGVAFCVQSTCALACDPGYDLVNGTCMVHVGVQWTRESTAPFAPNLHGVWGSGPDDVYAVGDSGFIAHRDARARWVQQPTINIGTLRAIWGSGPTDVYAVGDGGILHSSGDGNWTAQTSAGRPSLSSVWGSGAGDVYAGSGAELLHTSGGNNWSIAAMPGPPVGFAALWGSGAGDLYAVDQSGYVFHGSGSSSGWTQQNFPSALYAVCGSGANDLYAVGYIILHSGGNQIWAAQALPSGATALLTGCWASSPTDVYAVGDSSLGSILHSTGKGDWALAFPTLQAGTMSAVWGSSATDVYAAGVSGMIQHLH